MKSIIILSLFNLSYINRNSIKIRQNVIKKQSPDKILIKLMEFVLKILDNEEVSEVNPLLNSSLCVSFFCLTSKEEGVGFCGNNLLIFETGREGKGQDAGDAL